MNLILSRAFKESVEVNSESIVPWIPEIFESFTIYNRVQYFLHFYVHRIRSCEGTTDIHDLLQRVNRSSTGCRQYSAHRIRSWANTFTASATHWTFHIWKPGWTWTRRRKSLASTSIPHKVCSTPLIRTSWSFSTGPRSPLSTRTTTVSSCFISFRFSSRWTGVNWTNYDEKLPVSRIQRHSCSWNSNLLKRKNCENSNACERTEKFSS